MSASALSNDRQTQLWHEVDEHLIRYGGSFAPVLIGRARGAYVYDLDDRPILDFTSGQMCASLGHNHPEIVAAIEKACREAIHLFSGMLSPPVIELAGRLAGLLPAELQKSLFLSTGGEAKFPPPMPIVARCSTAEAAATPPASISASASTTASRSARRQPWWPSRSCRRAA